MNLACLFGKGVADIVAGIGDVLVQFGDLAHHRAHLLRIDLVGPGICSRGLFPALSRAASRNALSDRPMRGAIGALDTPPSPQIGQVI